jgi:hypothetical protein
MAASAGGMGRFLRFSLQISLFAGKTAAETGSIPTASATIADRRHNRIFGAEATPASAAKA